MQKSGATRERFDRLSWLPLSLERDRIMSTYRRAQRKSELLCRIAIEEICQVLMEEGGVSEVLTGLAVLLHGKVLPAPVILQLEQQANRIVEWAKKHSA